MFLDPEIASCVVARVSPHVEQLAELCTVVEYRHWPEPLYRGRWDVFGMKWQGQVLALGSLFGWLRHPAIHNAGFSRLAPGTIIEPHVGYTADVLRLHLGLWCPAGASITVGGETRSWRTGEFLLFDDTVEHSARNLGDEDRIILLVDVLKEALP